MPDSTNLFKELTAGEHDPRVLAQKCVEQCSDEHFVQFYESEHFLIESIANFVSAGFLGDETVLVLATGQHLNELRARLIEERFGLDELEKAGRFVPLDAQRIQSDLTIDGNLSRNCFNEFFGGLLSQAMDAGRPIRVFGELVAVLWAQGKYATAIQVEELWNGLKSQMPFSLFCAYPLQGFAGKHLAESLKEVCLTHSRIIPSESYLSLNSVHEKQSTIADLQRQCISLEHEIENHRHTQDSDLQRRLDESLERERLARADADAANRLKDEFLSTVSHELRTPLNAIVGWSHLLNRGRLDASTSAKAMESIERNARVQAQMIENLLDVSRLAAGTLTLNVKEVDLPDVIHAAIGLLRSAADAKKIDVLVDVDRTCEPIIGDARRLQQIFWHLLDNAIKFTPPNGRIRIGVNRIQHELEIVVEDSGQGIEFDLLPCVFEKFWQADSSTTRKHGGLGVGLSIVRYLVELHGGSVSAESEGTARGSRFVVKLPDGTPV